MRKSRSIHLLKGELIMFTNKLNNNVQYGQIRNNFSIANKPHSRIPLRAMPLLPRGNDGYDSAIFVKNITKRLGITTLKEYMHNNPERFI